MKAQAFSVTREYSHAIAVLEQFSD